MGATGWAVCSNIRDFTAAVRLRVILNDNRALGRGSRKRIPRRHGTAEDDAHGVYAGVAGLPPRHTVGLFLGSVVIGVVRVRRQAVVMFRMVVIRVDVNVQAGRRAQRRCDRQRDQDRNYPPHQPSVCEVVCRFKRPGPTGRAAAPLPAKRRILTSHTSSPILPSSDDGKGERRTVVSCENGVSPR